ncbi:hypothetical protein JHK82_033627 [Glycine max]|nr:hypothetical protein JHK85_034347 [Glycine max]KAG5119207.1 hypothetical protein JHK82_033627 [Glycine max]KAG5140201.1 hypothetical protein JHK84_033969 [Glycine max]
MASLADATWSESLSASLGKLVDPHPLAWHKDKFYHVMQTGLLYCDNRSLKPRENKMENDELRSEDSEEEEVEMSDQLCEIE